MRRNGPKLKAPKDKISKRFVPTEILFLPVGQMDVSEQAIPTLLFSLSIKEMIPLDLPAALRTIVSFSIPAPAKGFSEVQTQVNRGILPLRALLPF